MALHINNARANQLARKLAASTGETLTDAVTKALEERLARQDARSEALRIAGKELIRRIAEEFRALPVLDDRPADEILGYDQNGLP
jgi:antitoxin VapB